MKLELSDIKDDGLDQAVSRLSTDRIQQVINETLDSDVGASIKASLKSCVHCGLCAMGCHYYVSHKGNPRYSPVAKVKETLWEFIRTKGRISPEYLKHAALVAYTECNLCRRCVMYCPFGIDTAQLMTIVRRICHTLGATPKYLQDTAHSHAGTMNQMWVKDDEWIDSLLWQEEEARDEVPTLRIPLEKEGADVFYSVIGPEPKFRTQLIYQTAVIMNLCGVDWTMPALPGWDNSDLAMFSGDFEIMGRLKRLHFDTAMRLKVNRIVMGECGHAFRSVYDTGNRWLGWKDMPVPVVHGVRFYWELFRDGKIRVGKKIEEPVTFHDPCNISRGMGLHDQARELVHAFCPNYHEMYPNREQNYCCAAGGGVIGCGPPHRRTRVEGNRVKAEQLRATGAKIVVAPCHNCHGGLEDLIKHYQLDMEVKFMADVIYECMEKPDVSQ